MFNSYQDCSLHYCELETLYDPSELWLERFTATNLAIVVCQWLTHSNYMLHVFDNCSKGRTNSTGVLCCCLLVTLLKFRVLPVWQSTNSFIGTMVQFCLNILCGYALVFCCKMFQYCASKSVELLILLSQWGDMPLHIWLLVPGCELSYLVFSYVLLV
jgi:hypothetical protein